MFDFETFVAAYSASKQYIDEHGGGGGTTDYADLENKPKINGTTLSGNKSLSDLGIVTPTVENETLIFS